MNREDDELARDQRKHELEMIREGLFELLNELGKIYEQAALQALNEGV